MICSPIHFYDFRDHNIDHIQYSYRYDNAEFGALLGCLFFSWFGRKDFGFSTEIFYIYLSVTVDTSLLYTFSLK